MQKRDEKVELLVVVEETWSEINKKISLVGSLCFERESVFAF